jgi:metal-responsive CopG/Arc/MetJ family transcriptional regulator
VERISLVIDVRLLKATDIAAKRQRVSRSALIRQALQENLKRLHVLELEERDRRGYEAKPQRSQAARPWQDAAAWPKE